MMIGGCNSIDVDPLQPDEQEPENDPVTPNAIAMSMSQSGISHPEAAPDDLVILFASEAQECADPLIQKPDSVGCGSAQEDELLDWQVFVVVPADLVGVGLVDLDGPTIYYVYSRMWTTCGYSVGHLDGAAGTLDIVSLDATSISVKLDLDPSPTFPDINGDYTAPLCP